MIFWRFSKPPLGSISKSIPLCFSMWSLSYHSKFKRVTNFLLMLSSMLWCPSSIPTLNSFSLASLASFSQSTIKSFIFRGEKKIMRRRKNYIYLASTQDTDMFITPTVEAVFTKYAEIFWIFKLILQKKKIIVKNVPLKHRGMLSW